MTGVGPVEPGDPRQRLARGGRQAFLLVLCPAVRVAEDRGRVIEAPVSSPNPRRLAAASRAM
jgi:hypothetical protein